MQLKKKIIKTDRIYTYSKVIFIFLILKLL